MPQLALKWLREVLRAEFSVALPHRSPHGGAPAGGRGANAPLPGELAATAQRASRDPLGIAARYQRGEVEDALWYREWHRRWRRLQLPLQFAHFVPVLSRAQSPDAVFRTLAEHALEMVGGYTCLLFPPQETVPLRPLPNPVLRVDPGCLTLSVPLAEAGSVRREEVLARRDSPLAGLAALFLEERAVSLAYAPFGAGGVIVLIERRRQRIFDAEDRELLRVLTAHAAAALLQVRGSARIDAWRGVRAAAILGTVQAAEILDHAIAMAEQGEPLAVARLQLDGLRQVAAEDGESAVDRIRRTAAEVLHEMSGSLGIPLHHGDAEFLLVLPRLGPAHTEVFVARLQRLLPARVHVRAGVAAYRPGDRAPELLARAHQTLRRARGGAAGGHPP